MSIDLRDFADFKRIHLEGLPTSGLSRFVYELDSDGDIVCRSDMLDCLLDKAEVVRWREIMWDCVDAWEYAGLYSDPETIWYRRSIWSFGLYLKCAFLMGDLTPGQYLGLVAEMTTIMQTTALPHLVVLFDVCPEKSALGKDYAQCMTDLLDKWSLLMESLGVEVLKEPPISESGYEQRQAWASALKDKALLYLEPYH